ncbi:MAG: GNAT family N-acetyltransferase [Planctomycetales bacterium]
MSRVDVVVECPIRDSFRVRQAAGMFDLPIETRCREEFSVEIPGPEDDWKIGVIVGPSGSGKSTVARAAFGDAVCECEDWDSDAAVIDGLGDLPIKQLTHLLTAVGFSSPPSWLKPYRVLSNGERFRCDLARALCSDRPLTVFDEFSSVVDRTAARTGSAAVSKAIRSGRLNKRFAAVTCHYDVLPWLEPDWVLDMANGTLSRRRLRRPAIQLELFRCRRATWKRFARHHYLSQSLSPYAECFLATWNDEPVAFCAVLNAVGRVGLKRVSRVVVLPDYQGIGIGGKVCDATAGYFRDQGRRVLLTASHPAVIQFLKASPRWRIRTVKKSGHAGRAGSRESGSTSRGRAVVGAEFVGDPVPA